MLNTKNLIYSQLDQFVQSSRNLLAILPKTKESDLIGQYFPLRFEANILVSDKAAYYFMVSQSGGFIKRGRRSISLMTLKANQVTWLQILNGHKSLMQEYNRGNVILSNARANLLYKLVLLSVLFETRDRIARAGRMLRIFPLTIIRTFLHNIDKYIPTILNRIPSSIMQSILNLASRLSERLEK